MHQHLSGRSEMYDAVNRVVLRGEIALITDGVGRSEIVISDNENGRIERLVFSARATWIPVMQLIQAIQDIHRQEIIEEQRGDPATICAQCGGAGVFENHEGNWQDCQLCVP